MNKIIVGVTTFFLIATFLSIGFAAGIVYKSPITVVHSVVINYEPCIPDKAI